MTETEVKIMDDTMTDQFAGELMKVLLTQVIGEPNSMPNVGSPQYPTDEQLYRMAQLSYKGAQALMAVKQSLSN